ncbi:hypothetical protein PENSTE_c006G04985 [Penicillium steckii]|uniref:Uncharacterized protein n=1 Tax=Penicillium steckii TaxID=303698 RepID=A0A1V6TFX4_9EURO|nr:hypothetical protein PENSTE_c006G04985 [Penicillium steckii]
MSLRTVLALGTAFASIALADPCSLVPACHKSFSSCVPHTTCTLPISCSVPSSCSSSVPITSRPSRLVAAPSGPVVYTTPVVTTNTPQSAPASSNAPASSDAPAVSDAPASSNVPASSKTSNTITGNSSRLSSSEPPVSFKPSSVPKSSSSSAAENDQTSSGVDQTHSVVPTSQTSRKSTKDQGPNTTPGSSRSKGPGINASSSSSASGNRSQDGSDSAGDSTDISSSSPSDHIISVASGSIVSTSLSASAFTTRESGSLETETIAGAMTSYSVPPSTVTEDAVMITTSISGSMVTTDVLISTIDPSGSEASSSAKSYSTQVAALVPLINSWVKHPEAPEATAALDAIKKTTPEGIELGKNLGGSSSGGCSNKKRRDIEGRSLFGSLFDAVKGITCGAQNIENSISKSIESDNPEDVVKDVESQLKDNLKPDLDSFDDVIPKEPNDSDSDPSTSPSDASTSSETSTKSSSETSSTSTETSSSTSSSSKTLEYCSPKCSACSNDDLLPAGLRGAKSTSSESRRALIEPKSPGLLDRTLALIKRQFRLPTNEEKSSTLTKRVFTEPTRDDWQSWFQDLTRDAYKLPQGKYFTFSTALMTKFEDQPKDYAVLNLYGCTSVILISKYGLYMSHFWEEPSFVEAGSFPDVSSRFKDDVLERLEYGIVMDMWGNLPINGIHDEIFTAKDAETKAVIVTPSDVDPLEGFGPPVWPEEARQQENRKRPRNSQLPAASLKYPDQVGQIADKIRDLIGGSLADGVKIRSYTNAKMPDMANEDEETVIDSARNICWGKVLVQYDNNFRKESDDSDCTIQYAGAKAYLGDNVFEPILEAEWPAMWMSQFNPAQQDQVMNSPSDEGSSDDDGMRKRRVASCNKKAYSSVPLEIVEETSGLLSVPGAKSTGIATTSGRSGSTTKITSGLASSTTSSTTSSTALCSLEIVDSSSSICDCQSTTAKHSLSHRIMKPTDKACSDIKTFPMTSFLHVPSTAAVTSAPKMGTSSIATSASCDEQEFIGAHTTQTFCVCTGGLDYDPAVSLYSTPTTGPKCTDFKTFPTSGLINEPAGPADPQICRNPGASDKHERGYCKCQNSNDIVQWAPLPHIQGTATVLEGNCQAISSISFSTPTVAPPKTVTDYTETDPMDQSSMYAEGVVITTDYGVVIGPNTVTRGVGAPTEIYKPEITSTLANSDIELTPAKTIEGTTKTIAAEPTIITTHAADGKCKAVNGGVYFIYIVWDVFDWTSDKEDFPSLASAFKDKMNSKGCGVTNFQWKEFVDSYGPSFSFNTAIGAADGSHPCVENSIKELGGPDTLCDKGDYNGVHWWKDNDSIAGLLAHGTSDDDPYTAYEPQASDA